MNKTLLLILVDFLLLTILSMWKAEEDAPATSESEEQPEGEASVSAMAMMEQDLLDTLRYSLEEEQEERSELSQSLEEQAAELERRQRELEERESRIQNLEQNLTQAERREQELAAAREQLERDRQALQGQVEQVRSDYASVSSQLQETQQEALERQAQARMLQEELQQKLAEIERKESLLEERTRALSEAEQRASELDTQVKMSEQEKAFLRQSVDSLRGEIVAEREERERLQEQAGVLAQGVSELASSSQDLRAELRSSFEINANQLFSDFKNNQIFADVLAVQRERNRFAPTEQKAATIKVTDGERFYALTHLDSLPFDLRSNASDFRSMIMRLRRGEATVPTESAQFLALDPRIVVVPLTSEEAETLGGTPYLTALEPFKFPEAVLVNRQGDYYGEVEFKLDADTPGFVRMQNKVFSSIFGEFSPSTGDLVLSKTGELLGIMVNRRYCALVNNFVTVASLEFGDPLDSGELERVLRVLNNTLNTMPRPLR